MKFNKENIKALLTKERLIGIGIGAFVAALFAGSCWYAWYCGNQAYMENGGVAEPISTVTSTDVVVESITTMDVRKRTTLPMYSIIIELANGL